MAEAVQISNHEIKQALKYNGEFFIQFFLEDELTLPVPDFHKDIFQLMTAVEILRFVCAIPRDHAKTTLAKLAAVWYFLFSDYRFIVYISNTSGIAIPAVNDIMAFMQCDNFRAVFGNIQILTNQEGKGIYKFKIGDKICMLRAMGASQQVRGINIDNQRPQLAIIDDLEDNDNIASETLFMQLKRWVYGPFMKCLDKFHNKIIWLGNMISSQSMLYENCHSNFWHSRLYGCMLSNGKPLWPDAWTLEKLQRDFAEYQHAGMADVWFAEMMNQPFGSGNGLIKPEEITYRPAVNPGEPLYGFITIDLAISEETWAHQTVVCCHGWMGDLWQIVEYVGVYGADPVTLWPQVRELVFKWGFTVVGIENVAYQASLKHVFRHFCLTEGIEGLEFVPLAATGRKLQRLAPWAGLLKSGDYALTEGDVVMTQELLTYNPKKPKQNKDDNIDAASYGPQMMDNFMDLILNQALDVAQDNKVYTIRQISEV